MEIPNEYLCPVSLEIMSDPVVCEDGHSYDRESILKLKKSQSPITRQPIDLDKIIPNRKLKELIEEFASSNGIKLKKNTNTNSGTDINSDLNYNLDTIKNKNTNTNTNSNSCTNTYYNKNTYTNVEQKQKNLQKGPIILFFIASFAIYMM
jgi:hypothetical protein